MVRVFAIAILALLLVNHVFTQETHAPSAAPETHPSICKGQTTGTLIADSTCTSCFYECDNGLAYRFHCPSHLIFNDGAHRCIADPANPVVVPCLGTSKFDCHGKADGFYPDPSSRTSFHGCDHGCGSDFVCSPSTYWDSSRNVCAYDDNAHHDTPAPWTPAPTVHHDTPAPWTPAPTVHQDTPAPWTPAPTVHQDTPAPWTPAPTVHQDTPAPWTPPPTVHHEETTPPTPTHWTPEPWTQPNHDTPAPWTQAPTVHHEDTTSPPFVTPPNSGEQSTRGRHGD